jgi:hypothetical protein
VGLPALQLENINAPFTKKAFTTYREFPTYLPMAAKRSFFNENGDIGMDWAIMDYKEICA